MFSSGGGPGGQPPWRPPPSWDWRLVFKNAEIPPHVVAHLRRVYATLAAATLLAAGGAYANTGGGLVTPQVAGLLFLLCALALRFTAPARTSAGYYDASAAGTPTRLGLLAGAATSQGAALGPLVGTAAAWAPSALITSLGGSAAVFACFTLSALLARRRSYLFLGGALSSALSLLLLMQLAAAILGGGARLFQAELYGGLLMFTGYVLFDSQAMVERAAAGARDFVADALTMFVDLAAIFTRLLVILLQQQQQGQGGSGRRERREEDEDDAARRRRRGGYDPARDKGKGRAW